VAKFPEPPPLHVLAGIAVDPYVIATGTLLWRVYPHAGRHPRAWNACRSFGPVKTMRFDHHSDPAREQERRILYGASSIAICVAEFFQEDKTIDRFMVEPWLVGFTVKRDVTLLNLCGAWPTRAGASMEINSGQHGRARRWSRVIYDAYPNVEGLWYSSSMYKNEPAFAFYERVEPALELTTFYHEPLSHRGLLTPLNGVARELSWGLL